MRQDIIERLVISATANTRILAAPKHWAGPALHGALKLWLSSRVLCWFVTAVWLAIAVGFGGLLVSGGFNPPRGISASGQLIPPLRPNPSPADVYPWVALAPLLLGIVPWFGLRWHMRFHQRKAASALKQIIIDNRVTQAEWHVAAALIDQARSPLLECGMREWLEQWCRH